MHRTLARLAAVGLFCVTSTQWITGQQGKPAAASGPASMDELLVAVRQDLQLNRADKAHLDRDAQMTALRLKALPEFQPLAH